MSGKRCLRPLICPICDQDLNQVGKTLQCIHRHTFDIAREGYVNLLVRRNKVPDTVGDSAPMLQARRRFLAGGWYDPLADKLREMITQQFQTNTRPVIADIGCGEGFYLHRLSASLAKWDACLFGADISKTAVRLAAKQLKHGRFMVIDINSKIPFADHSVQVLLNIFAPRNVNEFARVLALDGCLFTIAPQSSHLQELRQKFDLIDIQAGKRAHIVAQFKPHLHLIKTESLKYDLNLDNEAYLDLIRMTPNMRHLSSEQWQIVEREAHLKTEAAFDIYQFAHSK